MLKSLEAIVGTDGQVKLKEQIKLSVPHRAIVTILDEDPNGVSESSLLSEEALGRDWNRKEEDEAWSHLQETP